MGILVMIRVVGNVTAKGTNCRLISIGMIIYKTTLIIINCQGCVHNRLQSKEALIRFRVLFYRRFI